MDVYYHNKNVFIKIIIQIENYEKLEKENNILRSTVLVLQDDNQKDKNKVEKLKKRLDDLLAGYPPICPKCGIQKSYRKRVEYNETIKKISKNKKNLESLSIIYIYNYRTKY